MYDVEAATRALVVLPFSAHNATSLNLNIKSLSPKVGKYSLADIAYTLSEKRSRFSHRTFRIAEKRDVVQGLDQEEKVVVSAGIEMKKLCFIFTGQGAQWQAMGSGLFQYYVFAACIRSLDSVLRELENPPLHSIEDIIQGTCRTDIHTPEVSQIVCTAVQIGLVDLLATWDIVPSFIVGHSSGEIAAAYTAGRITAAEAIITAYCRGRVVSTITKTGAMLAIALGPKDATEHLQGLELSVGLAAINSPKSVTVSGASEAIEALSRKMSDLSIFNRKLNTGGIAYHSRYMSEVASSYTTEFARALDQVNLGLVRRPLSLIKWISSVDPSIDTACVEITEKYWISNLQSPVRFSEAVTLMLDRATSQSVAFIEIGPHPALKSPVTQILQGLDIQLPYLASLKRHEDGHECLLRLAGQLFCLNAPVDLIRVNSVDRLGSNSHATVHGCTAIDLPPYNYDYGPIRYHESRTSKEFRGRAIIPHELLGSKLPGSTGLRPQWRNILRLKDVPWIKDHQLVPQIVFPAAGLLSIVVESAQRFYEEKADALPVAGYSLRNVSIPRALLVPEDDDGIEIMTSLDLAENATAKAHTWMKFSISSVARSSDNWTEHCTGEVKVELSSNDNECLISTDMDPRIISSNTWYERFTQIGLGYGSSFQKLSEIRADPTRNLAVGKVNMKKESKSSNEITARYPIHPTALDAAFQLAIIACYGGQHERARSGLVLLHIDRLYMSRTNDMDSCEAVARGELVGLRGGHARLQIRNGPGDLAFSVNKLRFLTVSDEFRAKNTEQREPPPIFRLTWKPDVRLMTTQQACRRFPTPESNVNRTYLLDIFERFAVFVVTEIGYQYGSKVNLALASEGIRLFLAWVTRRLSDDTEWAIEAKSMTSPERMSHIETISREYDQFSDIRLVTHLYQNMGDILHERQTGLDIATQDGRLAALYETSIIMTGAYPQLFNYFSALGHVNPNMSILEVGAGTGSATRVILNALSSNGSEHKRYRNYIFTDISSGFLSAAASSLGDYNDVSFAVLNVEKDPLDQGFEAVYDVVVASECLHATDRISETLRNCKRMLKPGGKLVMVENVRSLVGHGLALGTLPGYWNGIDDGRADSPFLSLDDWDKALRAAGFSGVDIILQDYPVPHDIACVLITTCTADHPIQSFPGPKQALVYDGSAKPEITSLIEEELRERGVEYQTHQLLDLRHASLSLNTRVILFLGDGSLLRELNEDYLQSLQRLIRQVSTLTCITYCGFLKGGNPDGAIAAGLLRTLATENADTRFLSIDVQPDEVVKGLLPRSLVNLERALQSADMTQMTDREYIWQDSCLWVSRLVPDTNLIERNKTDDRKAADNQNHLSFDRHGPIQAAFETPGLLTSLYYKPYAEIWMALPDDWVQIKVAAVGLNWKDLAVASGRFDQNTMSSECSGIVDSIGSAVTNVAVGDRVYGYARGSMGNYVRTPAKFVQRLHNGDDFVKVATMPLVYMTALYAFEHVARLRKGEKVLIHSATGGLGLAAIQVAQNMEAEIFATVGSPEKADHLISSVGLPMSRVFSSRDLKDIPLLLRASSGKGFDVVLGTASGDMLYESIRLLSPLGRYIDVGRVDVQDSMKLGLELFQKSITFCSFDLSVVIEANPDLGHVLMKSVDDQFRAGRIGPISPVLPFDVAELDQALLRFSKGTHVGKLVINFQNPDSLVRMTSPIPRAQFSPKAQYLIVGGFGALGKPIINFMAERGARYFTVLSRGKPERSGVPSFLSRLASRGVSINQISCDVADMASVTMAIRQASVKQPIRGVLHAATSYEVNHHP